MTRPVFLILTTTLMSLGLFGCDDTINPDDDNERELITTVELTFTPAAGDPVVASWSDPEGDGEPVVDTVALDVGGYALSVRFLNALEDPVEDITEEVDAESDEHQVFVTGDAVDGPATDGANAFLTQAYDDVDANALPVGLAHTIDVTGAGDGDLVITLRHLPTEGGNASKVSGLAELVASGGFAAIPGDTDAQVTFPVSVQ